MSTERTSLLDEIGALSERLDAEIELVEREIAVRAAEAKRLRAIRRALNPEAPKAGRPKGNGRAYVKTSLRSRERKLVEYIELHDIERMTGPEVKEWTGLTDPDAYAALKGLRELGYLGKGAVEEVYGRKRQSYRVLDRHAIDHLREAS